MHAQDSRQNTLSFTEGGMRIDTSRRRDSVSVVTKIDSYQLPYFTHTTLHYMSIINRFSSVSIIIALAVLSVSAFFVSAPLARAVGYSPGDVLINEFSTDPSTGSDWYELLNTTSSDIDLSSWTIDRAVTSDSISLSGTLPANGILVFSSASNHDNDGGDMVTLKQGATDIYAVSYGTVGPFEGVAHTSAPDADQSASYLAGTWATSTPTKGWFNGAPAPTIATIVSGINEGGVTTNWGTGSIPDSSAATGLYFEKTDSGRVTFSATLNLTNASTTESRFLHECERRFELYQF